jgi:hypothetical protein
MAPHKYGLGSISFVVAMVNVSLGLKLALASKLNILYWPVMIGVLIVLFLAWFMRESFQRRWSPKQNPKTAPLGTQHYGISQPRGDPNATGGYAAPAAYGGNYEGSPFEDRRDIALDNMGAQVHHAKSESREPPPYDLPETKPREFA